MRNKFTISGPDIIISGPKKISQAQKYISGPELFSLGLR